MFLRPRFGELKRIYNLNKKDSSLEVEVKVETKDLTFKAEARIKNSHFDLECTQGLCTKAKDIVPVNGHVDSIPEIISAK